MGDGTVACEGQRHDVLDLTRKLQDAVDRHHLQHGQVLVFVPGSTAGGGREWEVVLQLSGGKS